MAERQAPVLIELEEDVEGPLPADAPEVQDDSSLPNPFGQTAVQAAIGFGARPPGRLQRWLLRSFGSVMAFALGIWAWDWVNGLIERNQILGGIALALVSAALLLSLVLVVKELAAFSTLRRIDRIRHAADAALDNEDLNAARKVETDLLRLYAARQELDWARANYGEARPDALDASDVLDGLDNHLMAPLDAMAVQQIERAARQVATATAILPLTMADVVVALLANLRMIRQVAEIYGGKSGTLGNWRLARTVMAHLVATGAVAIGDDLIGSVAGGGVVSKISRRFGEGVINGALTARVGVAAMDVCRPMPYRVRRRPSVSAVTGRALAGLFSRK